MERALHNKINSVEIILDYGSRGWILEKISQRVKTELKLLNCQAVIRYKPKFDTDVTFWIQYSDKTLKQNLKSEIVNIRSALVTHVDDSNKLLRVRNLVKFGVIPIFMSNEHAELIARTISDKTIFKSVHIGSDVADIEKLFHVGIVSNCYPDGRKNENWLVNFANCGLLENVELTIIGRGWEKIVRRINPKTKKINLYNGVEKPYPDYNRIIKIQKSFDLFCNFGFDEGSLGALDSYLLGKSLLVSKQGFQSSFNIDDNSFFEDFSEAKVKFQLKKDIFFSTIPNQDLWKWKNTVKELVNHWSNFKFTKNINFDAFRHQSLSFNFFKVFIRWTPKTLYRTFFVRLPRKLVLVSKKQINELILKFQIWR